MPQAGAKQWWHLMAKPGVGPGSYGSAGRAPGGSRDQGSTRRSPTHPPRLGPPCWGHRCPQTPAHRQQSCVGCSEDKPDPETPSNPPSSYARGCPPVKEGPRPPSFLPRIPGTSVSAPTAAPGMLVWPCPHVSPRVPSKIRVLGHPHPGADRDSPAPGVWWGRNAGTRGTRALAPARSLAPARQAHQLEDVLVLGHDGELQRVVTAGRGDGGVRVAGVGRSVARPMSRSAGSPTRR